MHARRHVKPIQYTLGESGDIRVAGAHGIDDLLGRHDPTFIEALTVIGDASLLAKRGDRHARTQLLHMAHPVAQLRAILLKRHKGIVHVRKMALTGVFGILTKHRKVHDDGLACLVPFGQQV